MSSPLEWPSFTVPENAWDESGDEADPAGRLTYAVYINGHPLHLMASAVKRDEETGEQVADCPYPEDVDSLFALAEPDGGFMTMTIRDREYVIYAYSFS